MKREIISSFFIFIGREDGSLQQTIILYRLLVAYCKLNNESMNLRHAFYGKNT